MRRITRQEISRQRLDQISSEERHMSYLTSRDAYKNSPEGLAEAAKRQEIQNKYLESEKTRIKNVNLLMDLKDYLMAHILADLDLTFNSNYGEKLNEEDVKRVMAKYQSNLDYLKEACLKYEKIGKGRRDYIYVSLYIELININPIFLKYCPVEVLYQTAVGASLPISVMTANKGFFMEKGYFNDPLFLKSNARYFTGISNISTMTDFDQIKKELKADPSLYIQLRPDMRYTLAHSDVALKNVLHVAPKVVAYMTKDEIYTATDNCSSLMGNIIIKYPELLKHFPADYFRRFNPKAVFARATRADIHSALNEYYDSIPELKRYMYKYVADQTESTNEFGM